VADGNCAWPSAKFRYGHDTRNTCGKPALTVTKNVRLARNGGLKTDSNGTSGKQNGRPAGHKTMEQTRDKVTYDTNEIKWRGEGLTMGTFKARSDIWKLVAKYYL